MPIAGVVHLVAQDGHGTDATTAELAVDAKQAAASALALVQGIADADAAPEKGLWFVTRGAQVLERERTGQLAGAALWGLGKVVARELPQLQSRMLDLDPEAAEPQAVLADELLFPDSESHIVHRQGRRQVARLVRTGSGAQRLALPEEADWALAPDDGGAIETLRVLPVAARALEPNEVRVAVEACGLNFLDVFRAMGLVEEGLLGEEFCGRIVEAGSDVTAVTVGDRVAGFAFGTFRPEVVTREELVALAPADVPATALATIPSVFVTCVLSYELAGLQAGDRVLIHAGAGGVGLAAIQLAQAAGAEVFATASARKQGYLRSHGVEHVFDSRSTAFGREVLEATGGAGVDVVLNSLTGEGFIEASLDCLAQGGRFVELARRDILSEDEMAALRPDVAYSILDLYTLKEEDPARPGCGTERCAGAHRDRRACAAEAYQMAVGRDERCDGLHARGAAHRQDRADDASPEVWTAAAGRNLSGDRRHGWHRLRACRMACRARRGVGRSERPQAAGRGSGNSDRGAARPRIQDRGRDRGRDGHGCARCDAGADGRDPAAARGRDP